MKTKLHGITPEKSLAPEKSSWLTWFERRLRPELQVIASPYLLLFGSTIYLLLYKFPLLFY